MGKFKIRNIFFSMILATIALVIGYSMLCPTIYLSNELYEKLAAPVAADGRLLYGNNRYIAVVAIFLITLIASILIDKFFDISGKIIEALKKNYMKLFAHTITFGSAVILGIVSEIVYRIIFGVDSIGGRFNTASASAFCALYVFIAIIITERKNFRLNPEKAVALMILTLGIFVVLAQPFSHNSWDIDSHYPWAVHNSFVGTVYYNKADLGVGYVETRLFITNGTDVAAKTLAASEALKQNMNNLSEVMIDTRLVDFSIAHLPSGIAIALARLFGASFQIKYYCGEIANLLVYTTLCYFAIKKLKSGKMIMSVVAMLPTIIFISSNYSYDGWVTGFSLLGTAYFISEIEQPDKPMRTIDCAIMSAAFLFAAMPKLIYVMLFVLPLFMRKTNWGKHGKKKYYFTVSAFLILTIVLFAVRSMTAISGSGDSRSGDVNPSEQIAFIFGNPLEYTKILLNFLAGYLAPKNAYLYTSNFAYLGVAGGSFIYLILMSFCALTDKEPCSKFKGQNSIRIIVIAIQFALVCMIATALYIDFTPVGSQEIGGCQQRYLIPLLVPFLLTVANPGINMFKNKAVYNFVIFAVLSITGLYTVYSLVALPMM